MHTTPTHAHTANVARRARRALQARRTCVVAARLDNLGKGASGAAVQNLNIAMGIDEKTGL